MYCGLSIYIVYVILFLFPPNWGNLKVMMRNATGLVPNFILFFKSRKGCWNVLLSLKNYMACGSLFGVCLKIYIKRHSISLVNFAHSLSQLVFFFSEYLLCF